MKTFLLGKGLVIRLDGATLEFAHKGQTGIYFKDLVNHEIIEMTEDAFWRQHQTGAIQVLDAVASDTTLIYGEDGGTDSASVEAPLSDLSIKWQEDTERKLNYMSKVRALGISRGQRRLLSGVLKKIATELNDPKAPPAASTIGKWMQKHEVCDRDPSSVVSGFANHTRHLASSARTKSKG